MKVFNFKISHYILILIYLMLFVVFVSKNTIIIYPIMILLALYVLVSYNEHTQELLEMFKKDKEKLNEKSREDK